MPNATSPERSGNNNVMTAAVLLCLAWLLPGLFAHDPWKPDEAYTFGLVYSALQGDGWLVPMLAAEPYLEHPPLFVVTAALFAKALSFALPLHDGARLASGLYVGLALVFVALAGRELAGRARGRIAALLLIGCVGLVVRAHQAIPDTALLAGFAIGCYGCARMLRRPLIGGAWLGTGVGLAFMAKGLLGPAVLVVSVLLLVACCRAWRTRSMAPGLAVALIAAAPWLALWPVGLYLESPELFSQWWANAIRCVRGAQPIVQHDRLHYLRILPWYAWPVLPLALWVLWGTRVSRFARPAIQLPVVVFVVALAALTACAPPRELHAMPLLIPLALLATPAVDTLRRGASNSMYWFGVMGFSFFMLVAWVYWSGLELGIPQRLHLHLHKLQPGYDSHVRWFGLFGALAYCVGWFVLLRRLPRLPERPVVVWAAGITLLWGMLNTLFVAYADAGKSYRSVVAEIKRALPSDHGCISSDGLGESQRAMLHYFGGIVTQRDEIASRRKLCELMIVQGLRSQPPEIPPGWHQVWEGTRPGEKEEYFWLYAYGPPQPL